MYTCGPTVYRYAHVGNLRSYLLADLIRRALLYHGLEVFHVKNITDVGHLRDERFDRGEDRMLVQAGLEHKTPAEIAAAYEAAFHADEALVNILPAHVFPRATEHIPEMVALAERLEDAGLRLRHRRRATSTTRSRRSPGYGRLSGNTPRRAARRAPRRGRAGQARPGRLRALEGRRRGPASSSGRPPRWGEGFPGWHLECSAMAMRYLGDRFDIHTGGIDNVFPHHEDEIAQSAPLVGGVPANHWVHGEFLLMSGRKMAKSAGNFQRVTELTDRGIDPLALRYLALTSRYAHKLDYSDASIDGAAAALGSLRSRLRALGPPPAERSVGGARPASTRAPPATGRSGIAPGLAGHGGGRGAVPRTGRPGARAVGAAVRRPGARSTTGSSTPSTTTSTCRRRSASSARSLRSDLPADERRWLVARRRPGPRARPRPGLGRATRRAAPSRRAGRRRGPGRARARRPGPARDFARGRRAPRGDRGRRLGASMTGRSTVRRRRSPRPAARRAGRGATRTGR